MTLRWILAAVHLVGFGMALGAIFTRGRAFRNVAQEGSLRRIFAADNFWGISALVLIATGLIRAFAGFEKTAAYYLGSSVFWIKMGLLVAILLLEIGPMLALIRWRFHARSGAEVDTTPARRFALVSDIQTVLLIGMVLAATALARGFEL